MCKLQHQLLGELFLETAKKAKVIESNTGLIAECEALAERLNEAAPDLYFSPLITPHDSGTVTSRICVGYARASAVRAAIREANLEIEEEIEGESDFLKLSQHLRITLREISTYILISHPQPELEAIPAAA